MPLKLQPINRYYSLECVITQEDSKEMSYLVNITSQDSIVSQFKKGTLSQDGMTYLVEEFKEIQESLHHDDERPFSLVEHGYRILLIQSEDAYILTGGNDTVNLLESEPEYVELVELPDGVHMYRACLMPDNECFLLIYALKGALRPELEQWFAEQSGCLAKEDFE